MLEISPRESALNLFRTALPYNLGMLTVAETDIFKARAAILWTEEERIEFCTWIAANPEAGEVISGSGGCRKVRWQRAGTGKRGGVRVIYFNRLAEGEIWLLTMYAKAVRGNIPAHLLKAIKEAL
ncbi:MAG: transcriptional regulator [Lysobacteraceae bacterium]